MTKLTAARAALIIGAALSLSACANSSARKQTAQLRPAGPVSGRPLFPILGDKRPYTGRTRQTAPATAGDYRIATSTAYHEWPTPAPRFDYLRFQGQRSVGNNQEPGYFACRPTTQLPQGCGRPHRGIDIYAHYGAPIVAPEDGELLSYSGSGVYTPAGKESKNGGSGRRFSLRGASGMTYVFVHTMGFSADIARRVGIAADFGDVAERAINLSVRAGDVISYVGTTGGIVNPHLHLEVSRDGAAIDPASLWPAD